MVEGASLENWNTGNRIGGSNPSLSANLFVIYDLRASDTSTDTKSAEVSPCIAMATSPNESGTELRYCPVVPAANRRIKPDLVLVNGKEERHSQKAIWDDVDRLEIPARSLDEPCHQVIGRIRENT